MEKSLTLVKMLNKQVRGMTALEISRFRAELARRLPEVVSQAAQAAREPKTEQRDK